LVKAKRFLAGVPIECVEYRITNIGEAAFTVSGLALRAGFPGFRRYFQGFSAGFSGDDQCPSAVAPGHEAVIAVASDSEKLWIPTVAMFGKGPSSLWIKSVCGVIYLADGRRKTARLPGEFRGLLEDIVTLST
jgi:hypothetical protein